MSQYLHALNCLGHNPMSSTAWLAMALATIAASSCIPPELEFFTPIPPQDSAVARVTDTVLVLQVGASDSVSAEGVRLTYDLLDRAEATGRTDLVSVLENALSAVPEGDRQRGEKAGSEDITIIRRLRRQGLTQQLDLMRADALIIADVATDTVIVEVASEVEEGTEPEIVAHRWLALILTGDAVLDPEYGVRAEAPQ